MNKTIIFFLGIVLVGTVLAVSVEQQVTGTVLPEELKLKVYSPVEDGIYGDDRVPVNLSVDEEADRIEYIEWNDRHPRWKRLCSSCLDYGFTKDMTKGFEEGENLVGFRAFFGEEIVELNVSFFLDSKEPRISRTLPKKGSITNGKNFFIKFKEDNVEDLTLFISNNFQNSYFVNPNLTCEESKSYKECFIDINVSEYNGEEISYWFNISDPVRTVSSRIIENIEVDTQAPVINYFNLTQDGRNVYFVFNVTEKNFDEIRYTYIDDRGRERDRRLCTRLDKEDRDDITGICDKRKSFREGSYNVTFSVIDDAGNIVETQATFEVH